VLRRSGVRVWEVYPKSKIKGDSPPIHGNRGETAYLLEFVAVTACSCQKTHEI